MGDGHLYPSRFKSFPIQQDDHFLTVCHYAARNPLRANLTWQAQDWPWGSRGCPATGLEKAKDLLDDWPVLRPGNWAGRVNHAENAKELAALRYGVDRGRPFGDDAWTQQVARRLGLQSTLRRVGRPTKARTRRVTPSLPTPFPVGTIEGAELNRLLLHIQRERPYGDVAWTAKAAKRMGLEWTMRDRGRPRRKRLRKEEADR